ncbi:unnamed protein product [Macrosiphum euphorbiae]|uniref:Uncharacterized protein n=1 Tax=Macrosiphum euphorbiae TaxID=13131 RepID=A0AAV0XBB1_9HEMI|nr:unnamed protein product [Macrosiphum euphorbiae]
MLPTLGAIPKSRLALTFSQVMTARQIALRLKEAFEEMGGLLNKDRKINNRQCSDILEKTVTATCHQVN